MPKLAQTGDEPCTTREAVTLLAAPDRKTVLRLVESGALVPLHKLPGATGAYLFRRADVLALAEQRAAGLRATLERIGSAS
jgi:hypothetical protein